MTVLKSRRPKYSNPFEKVPKLFKGCCVKYPQKKITDKLTNN